MKAIVTLIGFASTATVITMLLGVGYLWGSARLDDEKVFRIVALLHDVYIEKIASETEEATSDTPPEEPSPQDVEWQRQVLARNYEVKLEALKRGKLNFDASLSKLATDTNRFHELAEKLERQLEEQGELSSKRSLQQVVQNLELMKADQAKEQLKDILKENKGIENTIKIMSKMSTAKLKKILQQFQTPEEQNDLHIIYQRMLEGGAQQTVFQNALEDLHQLKSQQP